MRGIRKKGLWVAGLSLVLMLSLTGCGSSQATSDSAVMEDSAYTGAGLAKASSNDDAGYDS